MRFRGRDIWEYKLGPAVDASGVLAGGREFKNVNEFKQLLIEREDQVARNLTKNLLTYATGAGIEFADRDVVERISARLRPKVEACARSFIRSSKVLQRLGLDTDSFGTGAGTLAGLETA